MRRTLALLLLLGPIPFRPAAALTLNEVLYDPPGDDGGHEFVELFHGGPEPFALDGVRLVFINGAAPEREVEVWRGGAGHQVPAGGFFVVGGAQVAPRQADLKGSLQNGPDALNLVRDAVVLDALAWGEAPGLGEGAPAPDPSGTSLGRVPDGADSEDNARDWRILPAPTPGRPNALPSHLRPTALRILPPWRPEPGPALATAILEVAGYASSQSARLRWELDDAPIGEAMVRGAPGDSLQVQMEIWAGFGLHRIHLRCSSDAEDSLGLPFRVGVGPVVLNEVLPRPAAPEPEWIELRGRTDAPAVLEGWAVADQAGDFRELPPVALGGSGGFALLCPDPAALAAVRPVPMGTAVVAPRGGWPTLNNDTDAVLLRDGEGVVVDLVVWGEDLPAPEGRSLERALTAPGAGRPWLASPADPTPGAENPSAQARLPTSGLAVHPNPFSPDGDGDEDLLQVALRQRIDGPVRAEILDLTGERVRLLGEDAVGGEIRLWQWDGKDQRGRPVPLGAYLVRVLSEGPPPRRWSTLVALGRRP
jgi:hypothetical protein